MSHIGARAALVLSSILFAACGAKTLDFSADGGSNTGTGGTTGGADGGPAGPYVTKPFLKPKVSKIDLLFLIDNSSSMADKQQVLGDAVPELVDWLVQPKCVDPITGQTVGNSVNGVCALGELPFQPSTDIHIGIISSSLGSHGAPGVCDDAIDVSLGRIDPHNDDRAHLLTRRVGGTKVPTFNDQGFLYFNPSVSGGLANSAAVAIPFTDMVKGVGQHGCGYSAPLEAVYRFLVDPDPYDTMFIDTTTGGFGQAVLRGTDQALLQQRADFLRPDSLVSVMIITDGNDCSVVDGGQGFYPLLPPIPSTGRSALKHGTSACLTNPNDKCCTNCGVQVPPAGCPPLESDPECQKGELTVNEDQPNLRCFDQKKRYGVDFLYPVQRYIDGFTSPQVPNRQLQLVPNPLFSDLGCKVSGACAPPRDRSLVEVAGIVGVPWQDIALDPGDLNAGFKNAQQLRADNTWANIVGDPKNASGPVLPIEPHMIESIGPRPGLPGPGSGPNADIRNGHEWDPSKDMSQPNADLQYACIFPLSTPKICTESADCDCFGANIADVQNPVCQNAQGAYTNTQLRGKAYPGTRILQVLQGIGDQAIVGSLCPANITDKTREDYGYDPVVKAVIERLRTQLADQCLDVALPMDAKTGQTPCSIIEVFTPPACHCDTEPGRRTPPDALLTDEMKASGTCLCEIQQLSGDMLSTCQLQLNPPLGSGDGWCYVDPAQLGNVTCDVVRNCAPDQKRRIHFINTNSEPRSGATTFLRCETQPIAPLPSICH